MVLPAVGETHVHLHELVASLGIREAIRVRGIAPGDDFEVVEKQPFDGPVFASFAGEVHVLGGSLARAMRVEL